MKAKSLLFFVAIVGLIFSCSKDDADDANGNGNGNGGNGTTSYRIKKISKPTYTREYFYEGDKIVKEITIGKDQALSTWDTTGITIFSYLGDSIIKDSYSYNSGSIIPYFTDVYIMENGLRVKKLRFDYHDPTPEKMSNMTMNGSMDLYLVEYYHYIGNQIIKMETAHYYKYFSEDPTIREEYIYTDDKLVEVKEYWLNDSEWQIQPESSDTFTYANNKLASAIYYDQGINRSIIDKYVYAHSGENFSKVDYYNNYLTPQGIQLMSSKAYFYDTDNLLDEIIETATICRAEGIPAKTICDQTEDRSTTYEFEEGKENCKNIYENPRDQALNLPSIYQ